MNIFVPYPNAKRNAEMLDDLRLNKMIVESSQMLCSALHRYGVEDIPYKNSYPKHPCTLWAGDTHGNAQYLYNLARWMLEERKLRGFGPHKCSGVLDFVSKNLSSIVRGPTTPFVNCTADYKWLPVHAAYKFQMCKKWDEDVKRPKWTRRGPPGFYINHLTHGSV